MACSRPDSLLASYDGVSYILGRHQTPGVIEDDSELLAPFPLSLKCWNDKRGPAHLAGAMLGMKPRVLYMLDNNSINATISTANSLLPRHYLSLQQASQETLTRYHTTPSYFFLWFSPYILHTAKVHCWDRTFLVFPGLGCSPEIWHLKM